MMNSLRRRSNAQQPQRSSWQGLDEGSLHSTSEGSYYGGLDESHTSIDSRFASLRKERLHFPVFSQRTWLVLGLILIVAPWMLHSSWSNKLKSLQKNIASTQQSQQRLVMDLQKAKRDLQKLTMEQSNRETINNELLSNLHAKGDTVDTQSLAYFERKELEDKYLLRIEELESALTKKLASMAIRKHGNGPYHVVVNLKEEPAPGVGKSFMIETVPNTAMPLSVGHFLGLVEHQFYDNLTLLHRFEGANMIQTADIITDTKRVDQLEWKADPHLKHLAFAEQNDDYRIRKYSVAFEGKPGGPHFYVFMDKKYNVADPLGEAVFGNVIQGQKVLDAMVNSQQQHHDQGNKFDMFTIESVRILPQKD
jgi:cyclophilin family peptidyl-prolyl cis-trans isomerase